MRDARSFCRVCGAGCGVRLTIDDDERIVTVRGDRQHPVSKGYACFKGLQAADAYYGPSRLLHPLKRTADGGFVRIPIEQALDEIAATLGRIRTEHGGEAIALFKGSGAIGTVTARTIHRDFLKAIGSRSYYSTFTIDQSAKQITAARLGAWQAGKDHIDQSDVVMLFGVNPLVSHCAMGLLISDPTRRLKQARARGMKLIVIDPRLTETARFADIALQPHPGEDPTIAAGLLRVILSEGLHDRAFCDRYVKDLAALERAVAPFTPDHVARRAGVTAEGLVAAARLFAGEGKRGAVVSGTGPDMAGRSNLAEHLIECINVVCGRFKRAGEPMPNPDVLSPPQPMRAEVDPPGRPWERRGAGRIRGAAWFFGEKLASTLADEILTPGPGQVRALIVDGGNPASVLPDKAKAMRAFEDLDLLVAIEPYMTNTARLAHYILPTKLAYERPDVPMSFPGLAFYADGWSQYTPAVVAPPPGSEVVDDWYVFWSIAKRLGLDLTYAGKPMDMERPTTSEALIPLGFDNGLLSLDEVKRHPEGVMLDAAAIPIVQPARPDAAGRFDVAPTDIAQELAVVAAEALDAGAGGHSHRLISRRMRHLSNSVGLDMASIRARSPFNPAYMHPDDLAALGLAEGDRVRITSDHGVVEAIVEADAALRQGAVSMSHGWGDTDVNADPAKAGASTNLLIADDQAIEPINAMVRMSGIPVTVSASA
jgi:anaerobic selenocysteine-containing dehydrogenase